MALFGAFTGKTLYFPGCSAKFAMRDVQRRHQQLLTIFNISYIKLSELEVCCGKPALDYGFVNDFRELKKKNEELFKNQKIKKIITSCPECYYTFKKNYDGIKVEHITQVILENIQKIEKHYQEEEMTFYDPCNPYKLPELYENPRKILEAVGIKVINLPFCKQQGLCCGAVMTPVSPNVAKAMAVAVLNDVKTTKLITTSPECCTHLRENNTKGIEILELSEVLL